MLKTQDPVPGQTSPKKPADTVQAVPVDSLPVADTTMNSNIGANSDRDVNGWHIGNDSPQPGNGADFNFATNMAMPAVDPTGGHFTWEMIGLGLEEPLPPQETIDELHQVYFDKIHPSLPMIHQYRYLAAMNL